MTQPGTLAKPSIPDNEVVSNAPLKVKPHWWKRALTSPFVLLILMLIIVDVAVLAWRSADSKILFQQNPRITAIRNAIETHKKPDVMVAGDSLIFSALYFADQETKLANPDEYDQTYLDARLLSKLLSKQYNRKQTDVLNLSVPGGTPTDACLLLNEIIAQGKAPKLLMYGLAPRAMADNQVPGAGAIGGKLVLNVTPPHKEQPGLSDYIDQSIRKLSETDAVRNILREFGQLGDSPSEVQLRDFYVGTLWQYYHDRGKVRSELSSRATQVLKPATVKDTSEGNASGGAATVINAEAKASSGALPADGKKGQKEEPMWRHFNPERFERDLANYNQRYNPPNFKKFNKQADALSKLAQLCLANNVHLLIVNMPLSEANRSLIKPEFYSAYIKKLNDLATGNGGTAQSGITFIDMSRPEEFPQEMFLDSVHLNSIGAQKFEDSLVSAMKQLIDKSKFAN